MIKALHLSKTFTAASGDVQAVKNITFELPEGCFAAITGKSGSGKSTLLSLLGALDKPTNGSVQIDNQDIGTLHDRKLTRFRCRNIGFVFQSFNLVPNLTALENVMLPMEFAGLDYRLRKQRARSLLNSVGITGGKQKRRPGYLSGGEQQRVAIARALGNRPKLILADEPTGNLDEETGKQIFDLLKTCATDQKTTIILVTHDKSLADRCDT
ncbi:MAG TPA: ABC transporter ATP-binding protein, partial [Candidatus Saccharimonadales bacterium]